MARRDTPVWRYSVRGELNQRTRAVPVMGFRRRVQTLVESLQLMGKRIAFSLDVANIGPLATPVKGPGPVSELV
jgi:hypothetical protein